MDQQSIKIKLSKTFLRACAFVLFALGACTSTTMAQETSPKFEIGAHFTTLNVAEKHDHDSGLGARFTYNLNNYLGLEAETNGYFQTREDSGNNETQGLFGVKAGIRKSRYGLFAKVRPGFTRFYLLGVTPGPNAFEQGHTRFSLDVGGVFEYYPSRNTAIRVDAGDMMVNFKNGDFFYQRLDEPMFVRSGLSHNLQINLGVAFRF